MNRLYDLVYEDDQIIIVNKFSGVPVIPGRTSEMDRSLKYALKSKYGEIFIVHRIDEETSGLVIMAKDADTHRSLNTMFQNREIQKKYLLLINGIPYPEEGTIELPLKKLNNQNKSIVHKEGKEAKTTYKVLEKFKNICFCEAEIHTGRHHQIRVHFNAINFPLLVDPIYGKSEFFLSEIKSKRYNKGKEEIEKPIMNRLSLHAYSLSFVHPTTKNKCSFIAEIPKDFRASLNQLRKNNV